MKDAIQLLIETTQALVDAADKQDWPLVEEIDSLIASRVELAIKGASFDVTQKEKLVAILSHLKDVHAQVLLKAEDYRREKANELRQLNKSKVAVNAYSKSSPHY